MNVIRAKPVIPVAAIASVGCFAYTARCYALAATFPVPPPLWPTASLVIGVALLIFAIYKYRQTKEDLLKAEQRVIAKQAEDTVNQGNTLTGDTLSAITNSTMTSPETAARQRRVIARASTIRKFENLQARIEAALKEGTEIPSELDSEDWSLLPKLQQTKKIDLNLKASQAKALVLQGEDCIRRATASLLGLRSLTDPKAIQDSIDIMVSNVSSLHAIQQGNGYCPIKFREEIERLVKNKDEVVRIQQRIEEGIKNNDQVIQKALLCTDDKIPGMIAELRDLIAQYEHEDGSAHAELLSWYHKIRAERIERIENIIKILTKYIEVSAKVEASMRKIQEPFEHASSREDHRNNEMLLKSVLDECRITITSFTGPYSQAQDLIKRLQHTVATFEQTQNAKLQSADRRLSLLEKEFDVQVKEMQRLVNQSTSETVCWVVVNLHQRLVGIEQYNKEQNFEPNPLFLASVRAFRDDNLKQMQLKPDDEANIKLLAVQGTLSTGATGYVVDYDKGIEKLLAKMMVLAITKPNLEDLIRVSNVITAIKTKNSKKWQIIAADPYFKDLLKLFYKVVIVSDPLNTNWQQALKDGSYETALKCLHALKEKVMPEAVDEWLTDQFATVINKFDYSASREQQLIVMKRILLFAKLIKNQNIRTDLLDASRHLLESVATTRQGLSEPLSLEGMPQLLPHALQRAKLALNELVDTESVAIKRWGILTHISNALVAKKPNLMSELRKLEGMKRVHHPTFYAATSTANDPVEKNLQQMTHILRIVMVDIHTRAKVASRSYAERLQGPINQTFLSVLKEMFSSDPHINYATSLAKAAALYPKYVGFLKVIGFDEILKQLDAIFTDLPELEAGFQLNTENLMSNVIQRLPRWKLIIDSFLEESAIPQESRKPILASVSYGAELSNLYAQIEQIYS